MPHHRASIQNILCPTDFSEFSERAMRRATSLARWFECPVTALHVIPYVSPAIPPGPLGAGAFGLPTDLLGESRAEVEGELAQLAAMYAKAGVEVRPAVATGHPWREIEACANELPADLVVLGTHGRSGWDRFLMGSTTEKLIRRLNCPALTIGPTDVAPPPVLFRRIVCAVDLTAASQATIDLAFSFAEKNFAHLTLVHVIDGDRPDWLPPEPRQATRDDSLRYARTGAVEEIHKLIEDAPAHYQTDSLALEGTAWREIVRFAEQVRADLIVVGAQGRGGLGESFLGSTANQTLRHAPCPVLLARPHRTRVAAAHPSRVA